jgi:N-acetylglucosaminyldiphosphoundecaprenol N-acetyl-beta-D-mannosaminyltransferase
MKNKVPSQLPKIQLAGVQISLGSFSEHIDRIAGFAKQFSSSYVCCVNSHMTVEANREPSFARIVNQAEFATSDGMPITKALKWICKQSQERVAGNDLLPALLKKAEDENLRVYFYGGKQSTLDKILAIAPTKHPKLPIAGAESPPFRDLSEEEMTSVAQRINAADAQIVFVSLGCPKQERWMASMHGRVNAIMLGVGGAFLLYAGEDTRAPKWMRDLCLEWAYRLILEPNRLWKRYLVTNIVFLWLIAKDYFATSSKTRSPISID